MRPFARCNNRTNRQSTNVGRRDKGNNLTRWEALGSLRHRRRLQWRIYRNFWRRANKAARTENFEAQRERVLRDGQAHSHLLWFGEPCNLPIGVRVETQRSKGFPANLGVRMAFQTTLNKIYLLCSCTVVWPLEWNLSRTTSVRNRVTEHFYWYKTGHPVLTLDKSSCPEMSTLYNISTEAKL